MLVGLAYGLAQAWTTLSNRPNRARSLPDSAHLAVAGFKALPMKAFVVSGLMAEHSLLLDDGRGRLQALFNLRAQNGNALFNSPDFFKTPVIHNAPAANAAGIIDDVKDAAVPAGTSMFNADWG